MSPKVRNTCASSVTIPLRHVSLQRDHLSAIISAQSSSTNLAYLPNLHHPVGPHGALGAELGIPKRFLSAATSESASARPACVLGTTTSRSRSVRDGS